jgi:hypothetical protein
MALFWLLIHSQALVLANIVEVESGFVNCYFPTGVYLILISYCSLLFKGILIPLLMIILVLWSEKCWKNKSYHSCFCSTNI